MLLTKPQRYILDCLQRVGGLRITQLEQLLAAKAAREGCTLSPNALDAMLRQLAMRGDAVDITNEIVHRKGCSPNEKRLEAIDVMLELAKDCETEFWAAEEDGVLLRFALLGERVRLFAVLESERLSLVRAPPRLSKTERAVILLSDDRTLPERPPNCPYYYALRKADGSHRFFTTT